MGFQSAGDFMFLAAKKYHLESQALGALVCEKTRGLISCDYSDFKEDWIPQKFSEQILFIQTKNSSASAALFLRTHEFMEKLNRLALPVSVLEIRILRDRSVKNIWSG